MTFNRAIISDILLWIALVLVVGLGAQFLLGTMLDRQGTSIVLKFRDASELTRGSMVRMMGTEVGFVEDLTIYPDHVQVRLRIYRGTLSIPSGSTFTVLFTGLAGAKSIEINLPDVPRPSIQGRPVYLVEEPIRLKDALHYTMDITQALQMGAENISDFFGKKKPVEELQFNIQQSLRYSAETTAFMDAFNRDLRWLRDEMSNNTLDTTSNLQRYNQQLAQLAVQTHPHRLRPAVEQTLNDLQRFNAFWQSAESSSRPATSQAPRYVARLHQVNQAGYHLNQRLDTMLNRWRAGQSPGHRLAQWEASLMQADRGLAQIERILPPNPGPRLHRARQQLQQFNHTLLQWQRYWDRHMSQAPAATTGANQLAWRRPPSPPVHLLPPDDWTNVIMPTLGNPAAPHTRHDDPISVPPASHAAYQAVHAASPADWPTRTRELLWAIADAVGSLFRG